MLILAFDTHGPHISVALCRDGTVIADQFTEMKRGQAEHLMAGLDQTLAAAEVTYPQLDALAVGIGPGNFTGIRLGVSTARGLSLGLGIPCRGISSFESTQIHAQDALVLIAGPKGHVYANIDQGPQLMSEEDALKIIGSRRIIAAPDVLSAYENRITVPHHPAIGVALAAAQDAAATLSASAPIPLYVKAPDAAPPRIKAPKIIE